MSRLRGVVLVTGVVAGLAVGCQIDNPGFMLIEGASSSGAATAGMTGTTGMTGEGTTGGSTASTGGSAGGSGSETGAPGTTGSGAADTGEGGSEAGTTGGACVAKAPCYAGPEGSMGVGPCQGGLSSCTALGEFKACEGEVLPQPDLCATADDEDCNNSIVGCTGCIPGTIVNCYSGPLGSEAVGLCKSGSAKCSNESVMGPCLGEVTPITEICDNKLDEDCDGSADNCG
jgi:hypothetical protein